MSNTPLSASRRADPLQGSGQRVAEETRGRHVVTETNCNCLAKRVTPLEASRRNRAVITSGG